MKFPFLFALVLTGLVVAGCQSRGPSFDPRSPEKPYSFRELKDLTNTVDIEEQAFTNYTRAQALTRDMLEPPKELYRLGPGDAIEIEVLGEAGSKAAVTVGPDGKIYYGLLQGTLVWGLTLQEVKETIEKGLKKYVRVAPDVTVTLRQVNSKTVWMLGAVGVPGLYPLGTPTTLLEAVSTAGGIVGTNAPDGLLDLQRSFVMRDGKLLPVDFEKLLRAGDLSQNIYLRPNDFIHLRPGVTRNVHVLGAVQMPGVVPFQDQLSLAGALMTSGGTVRYAHLAQVAIVRGSLTEPRIATVDFKEIRQGLAPDVRLQPGDIVYVPFVPWRKLAILAEGMLDSFVSTTAANGGYYLAYPQGFPSGPIVPVGPPATVTVPPAGGR